MVLPGFVKIQCRIFHTSEDTVHQIVMYVYSRVKNYFFQATHISYKMIHANTVLTPEHVLISVFVSNSDKYLHG